MRQEKQPIQNQKNNPNIRGQEYQPTSEQYHQGQNRSTDDDSCISGSCGCEAKDAPSQGKGQGSSFRAGQNFGADDAGTSGAAGVGKDKQNREKDPRYREQEFGAQEKKEDREQKEVWKDEGGSTTKDKNVTAHK